MLKIIKNRLKLLKNPKNIYESNYLLLIMLKHLFVFPLDVYCNYNKNKYSLNFNKRGIILPTIIIIYTVYNSINYIKIIYDLNFDIHFLYSFIQIFVNILLICVLYSINFLLVSNLRLYLNKIWTFDQFFSKAELIQFHKNLGVCHYSAFTIVLLVFISTVFRIQKFSLYMICEYLIAEIPFINMFFVIYCHFICTLILKQRFKLISNKLHIYNDNKLNLINSDILSNLKLSSDLCDVIEDVNRNFGATYSCAVTGALILIIMKLFYTIHFLSASSVVFILWNFFENIIVFLVIFSNLYEC